MPGGLVLTAMQIARVVEAHKAKVARLVPVYAMSGGTLITLAADEIVLGVQNSPCFCALERKRLPMAAALSA